jgi:hypothetical protein
MYPEYDAFPNAPGLSKKMGLTQATDVPKMVIGWGPWKKEWYSICSAHHDVKPNCPRCMVGGYRNVWKTKFGHLVFKVSPRFWRWWVN